MSKNMPQMVLFQDDEKALNYRYKLDYPTGSDIQIFSLEHDYDEFVKTKKLIGGRVNNQTLYFLHPYKTNEYLNESLGEDYFLKEKLELFHTIAYKLGAKSISTKVSFEETHAIETDHNGKARFKVVSLESDVKRKIENEYKKYLEISDKFTLQDNFDMDKNISELRKFIEDHNSSRNRLNIIN